MVVEIFPTERKILHKFFETFRYQRVFIDGTLDGHFGKAWADDPQIPQVALLNHALAYLGGDASIPTARELAKKAISVSESVFVSSEEWGKHLLEIHGNQFVPVRWTSFSSKSINIYRIRQLKQQIPAGFTVKRIDQEIANHLFEEGVLIYRTYERSPEKFVNEGVGFCVYDGAKIASVINSMAIYNGKLKGNIETLGPYRGCGLATAVAAHLVEYCLENKIEYCWEATNKASIAVAKKLGFIEEGQMTVYQHIKYLPSPGLN